MRQMKRVGKGSRILAFALSCAMMLGMTPYAAYAQDELGSGDGEAIALDDLAVDDDVVFVDPIEVEDESYDAEPVDAKEPYVEIDAADPALLEPAPEQAAPEAAAEATADAQATSKNAAAADPGVCYFVHRQTYGWEKAWSKRDGQQSGTTGKSKRLEGIRIKLVHSPVSGGISYSTHVQTYGWQSWRSGGAIAGTTGEAKRLEAIKIKLTGAVARYYDVYYRVHAQHFGWMGWAKNGAQSGTAGYSYRLEAIQIVLMAKGTKAPPATFMGVSRATSAAFRQKPKSPRRPSTPSVPATPASTDRVLITATGSRYHRLSGCRSTARANTRVVTLAEALSMGLSPCANCYH